MPLRSLPLEFRKQAFYCQYYCPPRPKRTEFSPGTNYSTWISREMGFIGIPAWIPVCEANGSLKSGPTAACRGILPEAANRAHFASADQFQTTHPPLPHNASLLAASFRRALRRLNGCCVREANTLRRLVRSPSRRCSPLRSTRVHEFLVTGSGRMLHPVIFQDTTRIQPGAGSNILRQVQTCAPSPLWPRRSAA